MNKVFKKIIFVGVMLSMGAVVRPANVEYTIPEDRLSSFSDLPPELIHSILQNLYGSDLRSAGLACKKWSLALGNFKEKYTIILNEHGLDSNSALKKAIQNNLICAVKPFLKKGLAFCDTYKPRLGAETSALDPNQERKLIQRNALELAIRANNEAIVRLLVEECGVDVDVFGAHHQGTVLWEIVRSGTPAQMKLLLGLGADSNIVSQDRVSSLVAAIQANDRVSRREKVRLLCNNGAIVAIAQFYGEQSVLALASEKRDVKIVEILINKLREELGVLGLEEKISMTHYTVPFEYGRERFAPLLNEALQAARAAGRDKVVAVLEQALEKGLPEPAGQ